MTIREHDPQQIVDEWYNNPTREVWIIDETKGIPPAEYKTHHREEIVFSLVRLNAKKAISFMREAARVRNNL